MSKSIIITVKILFTALLFAFIFQNINFQEIGTDLKNINLAYFISACVGIFLQFSLNAIRWKVTLDCLGACVPWGLLFRYNWSALFFNQALPASVGGDASRVWLLHKKGHPALTTVNSILIGHMGMLTGLLLISTISLITTFLNDGLLPSNLDFLYILVPSLLSSMIAGISVLCFFGQRFPKPIPTLSHDVRKMLRNTRALIQFLILSALNCFLLIFVSYLIGLALDTTIPLTTFLRLMPLVIIVSVLPISIGGWGPRETAMILLFSPAGLSSNVAFTLSVLLGFCTILVSLPGGLLYLLDRPPNNPTAKHTT